MLAHRWAISILTYGQKIASFSLTLHRASQKSLSAEHAGPEHGRLRRPGRFFAVSGHFAVPQGRQNAQKLQKRILQRLCLCKNSTFEKPWFLPVRTRICYDLKVTFVF